MKKRIKEPNFGNEESRTLKWFLILFYVVSISFDVFYNLISIYIPKLKDDSPNFLGYWIYAFMFALLPIAYILNKKEKQYQIKYLYFITYTFLTTLNDVISYFGKPELYKSGNAVEVFWLLLAPIFVSMPFFKVVTLGLLAKYIISGLIIKTPGALLGIALILIFSLISFILLNRFQSYVNSIKTSYDQQLVGIVKGVIATLELKDPYTRGHSERVASYALELAKTCKKFTHDELKTFNYACLLHDIGKIHIPDRILTKPHSLTKEEYEIIKLHTVVGAEAVSKVNGLKNCLDVIRSHHERWDGKGYPDQLKGVDIPILARITAIADAFDAMTSSRSYRAALTVDEAYNRILEGKGTQFDPQLVCEFQNIYPLWINIYNRLSDNLNYEEAYHNQNMGIFPKEEVTV